MDITQILMVGLIGMAAGVLSGLLGIGGAIVIIPALVMVLGFTQQMAQGTTLVMMVLPVGLLAAWQYYQQGQVNIKVAAVLALMFFIGGYFGAKFATHIPQVTLKRIFAVGLLLIAAKIFVDTK